MSETSDTGQPAHDDVSDFVNSPSTENPIGDTFNVSLSVPENIIVRMVDASILEDYEIWILFASILASALVGFIVAYLQAIDAKSPAQSYIFWTSVVFFVLFIASFTTAIRKRTILRKKGRIIKLRTSNVGTTEPRLPR